MVAHLEHECRRPDCYNIYSKMDTDSTHPKYCSQVCFDIIMERATRVSDLNQAVRDKDFQGLVDAIQSRVEISGKGCWVWQGSQKFKKGGAYPVLTISNKTLQLHRVVLELKHGKPLGSQHAHHMCANNRCVNPDHLQPVTHRENMAEMLARQSFLARIRELEDRVRELCPDDPLLNVIEVA